MTESVLFGIEAVPIDAESVELANEPIGDLAPLRRLTHLRELRLVRTNPHRRLVHSFADLEPLRELSNLEVIELARAPVDDLSPLAGLTRLRRLDLSHSQVSDLSPLRALTALEHLDVAWTPVADLDALRELTRLESLDVSGTQVVDLAPLRGVDALRWLECRDTSVADLGPLAELTALETVRVGGTKVQELAPLARLHALRELDLTGTAVSDLSPLVGLSQLQLLVLVGTRVADGEVAKLAEPGHGPARLTGHVDAARRVDRDARDHRLGDRDLRHLGHLGAVGQPRRQLRERGLHVGGVERPPERVTAGLTGPERGVVAQRAVDAAPGGEGDATFVGHVVVAKEKARHARKTRAPAAPQPSWDSLFRAIQESTTDT